MPTNPTRDRVNPEKIDTTPRRRPPWIRVQAPSVLYHESMFCMQVDLRPVNEVCNLQRPAARIDG